MKTYVDLFETYKGLFIASKKLKNRFTRYWGTTTIDGVEVFNKKLIVWPHTDDRPEAVKILKMFGMYQKVKKAKFKGIVNFYLRLNPTKLDDYSTINRNITVNHLNSIIPNTEFEVTLNYTDVNNPNKFNNWTSEEISSWLLSNYESLSTSSYLESRGDTFVGEAIGYYVLLDTDANFSSVVVEAMVTPVEYATSTGLSAYQSGISVTLKCKQISQLQEDDRIVGLMLNETNPDRKQKITTVFGLSADTGKDDDGLEWDGATAGIWTQVTTKGAGKTDSIWYKGQLRTAILDNSYMDRDRFAEILATCMVTGYKKKKTKWYKKVLAVVIVVVVTWVSWGYATAEAIVGTSAWLAAFATYMGIGALVMTAIQYMIAKSGDVGWAQYFGSLIQIVGIVSMVAGVAAFIQNVAKRGLMTVITEGFSEFTTEIASTLGIKTAGTAAAGAEAGAAAAMAAGGITMEGGAGLATAATKSLFGKAMDFLGSKLVTIGRKIAEYAMDQRVSTAREELGDATALAEQSREELIELTDREINIGVEDIKYYTTPLKLDNLPFEVDYLYEGTKFNIGRPSFVPTGLNIIDK